MSTNRKDEIEEGIKAYVDASDDNSLKAAFGTPGSSVIVPGEDEPEDTGQQWTTPSFLRAVASGVGLVAGSWEVDEFDLSGGQTSVTLTSTPIDRAALLVFKDGHYLRYLSQIPASSQTDRYFWEAGTMTVRFTSSLSGWLAVHYLAQT
jgi:hypothetical protein